ncbi:hypothetical protein Btru_019914 [Bulinus truncatus]|nr:hypothetical protein Btru_019914 [Bulinus truncatus]
MGGKEKEWNGVATTCSAFRKNGIHHKLTSTAVKQKDASDGQIFQRTTGSSRINENRGPPQMKISSHERTPSKRKQPELSKTNTQPSNKYEYMYCNNSLHHRLDMRHQMSRANDAVEGKYHRHRLEQRGHHWARHTLTDVTDETEIISPSIMKQTGQKQKKTAVTDSGRKNRQTSQIFRTDGRCYTDGTAGGAVAR